MCSHLACPKTSHACLRAEGHFGRQERLSANGGSFENPDAFDRGPVTRKSAGIGPTYALRATVGRPLRQTGPRGKPAYKQKPLLVVFFAECAGESHIPFPSLSPPYFFQK